MFPNLNSIKFECMVMPKKNNEEVAKNNNEFQH